MRSWLAIIVLLLWAGPAAAEMQARQSNPAAKTLLKEESTDTASDEAPPVQYNTVILQGLNKVTGHISRLEGAVDTVMHFDKLEITAHRCWKSNPEDRPENAALLEIYELKPDQGPQKIFLGWMFSSSPGLSSLEHPVYDITVLSCEFRKEKEPEKTEKEKAERKDIH